MADARATYPADGGPDDLPRAVLREREARYRENLARTSRSASLNGDARAANTELHGTLPTMTADLGARRQAPMIADGVVRAIEIPFSRLMLFGFKLVFAAVPAFVLLGMLTWFAMTLLQLYFPELTKMQVLIHFPK